MSKDEEIAYILGEYGISATLFESVNLCIDCDAFGECSFGAFPVNGEDNACKYYSHE